MDFPPKTKRPYKPAIMNNFQQTTSNDFARRSSRANNKKKKG